ncbi:hypothetical protein TKK_0017682 [Trichogramma kaykai]
MRAIRPVPVVLHDQTKPFVHKDLATCTHAFVRAKPIKKALDLPYFGPYLIHARPSKYFYVMRVCNKRGATELKTVSTSRLRPAFGSFDDSNNSIEPARDDNFTQNSQFCTKDTELQDNFDHEEVVPSQNATKNVTKVPKQPRNPKLVDKQDNSKDRPKKSVRFRDDHAYSAAHKTSRES